MKLLSVLKQILGQASQLVNGSFGKTTKAGGPPTALPSPREITTIRLESSTKCQLQCPNCPTGAGLGKEKIVGWGNLQADNFRKLIDENPQIKWVELSNWGEMFLNKDLLEIMKHACENDVTLTAANGTNFNSVSDKMAEGLVKYRFYALRVSIDGATNETYTRFRRNGNFDRVIKNIENVNRYKKEYNSEYPKMYWVFIAFTYNEHEIPMAREHAQRLGMEFVVSLNIDPTYYPIEEDHEGHGVPSLTTWNQERFISEFVPCDQLWIAPQINFDGNVLGCCHNTDYGHYGNVFESGLMRTLESELYDYTKGMLLGENPEREDSPCSKCSIYHQIKDNDLFHLLRSRLEA